ncbi:MAG TPA: diphosphate--fructose-6-phosphate 1-phosphotransferase, partial [Rhodospirillales bacterium]|nr:diphosphate--fructose-6-phosphate 1-phosphotransferase [Rhodospirillales bacterium]
RFDQDRFLAKVDAMVRKHGYCSVVVSEGLRWPDGRFVSDQGTRDAFGHAQLGGAAPVIANMIKEGLGLKYHWAVADYLQRAARHIASKTDVEQAYAVGKAAVEMALAGKNSVMPAIVRKSSRPYRWTIGEAPLKKVANREKMMPKSFITRDGFGITAKCREYLEPLIRGEDYPPYRNGMPQYVRLKNVAVPKRLPAFELR